MIGKLKWLVVFGAGYVLGARAGRGRYEQISGMVQELWSDARVQKTAGQAQQVVKEKAGQAQQVIKEKVGDKTSNGTGSGSGAPSGAGAPSGVTRSTTSSGSGSSSGTHRGES